MIITNSRYALVGYFITSYPTRAHGIIVIYCPSAWQILYHETVCCKRPSLKVTGKSSKTNNKFLKEELSVNTRLASHARDKGRLRPKAVPFKRFNDVPKSGSSPKVPSRNPPTPTNLRGLLFPQLHPVAF